MSSFGRNYFPLGIAIVFGIANGYYAFQPVLRGKQESSKLPSQNEQESNSASDDGKSK